MGQVLGKRRMAQQDGKTPRVISNKKVMVTTIVLWKVVDYMINDNLECLESKLVDAHINGHAQRRGTVDQASFCGRLGGFGVFGSAFCLGFTLGFRVIFETLMNVEL